MSWGEVAAIYKAKNEAGRESWEQTRIICYWNVVSMNGSKVYKKPADLFKLPWEKGFKMTSKEAKESYEGKD